MKKAVCIPRTLIAFSSLAITMFLLSSAAYVAEAEIPQAEHLLVLYNFDDQEAKDLSGKDNNGVVQAGDWADSMPGYGRAYEMKFVNVEGTKLLGEGRIDIPGMDGFHADKEEPFTIVAWLKTSCPTADCRGTVITKTNSFRIEVPAYGNWRALVQNRPEAPGTEARANGGAFPLADKDQWVHIAAVYDGKEVRLYKDGQADGKLEDQPDGSADAFAIAPTFGSYTGLIDEFAVWNVALTDDEIGQVIKEPLSPPAATVEATGKLPVNWGRVKTQH